MTTIVAQNQSSGNPEAAPRKGFGIPKDWRFCKIKQGQKGPTYPDWQNTYYTWGQVKRSPNIGLLLGKASGGVVALDIDGASAQQLLESWAELPPTATVTSGWSPDRKAYFFTVDPQYWEALNSISIPTGQSSLGWEGKEKPEELEIRWTGGQQVIQGTHPSGSEYQWIVPPDSIAPLPLPILEKWLEALAPKETSRPQQRTAPSAPARLHLLDFVSKQHREFLEQGTHDGGRNNTGHKLYADLYGCELWLSSQGVAFDGEADLIFEGWAIAVDLHNDKPRGQVASIIKSVERKGASPATPLDSLEKRLKWLQLPPEQRERYQQQRQQRPQPKAPQPEPQPIDVNAILEEAQNWAALCSTRLDPHRLFPAQLSQPLEHCAEALNVGVEGLIAPLLAVSGSLVGNQVSILAKPTWAVGPTLWTAVVAKSGQGKSPAQSAILRPLIQLDAEAGENYRLALEQYQKDLQRWEDDRRNGDAGPKPVEPLRRHFYSSEATLEALLEVHCQAVNGRGVLFSKHELAGLVLGMDQYKSGGKGNDRQTWLELADGGPIKRITKTKTLDRPDSNICVCGGIQPAVLDRIADSNDSDGLWARFLWFSLPMLQPEWKEITVNLDDLLRGLYSRLATLGQHQFTLSPDAKNRFIPQWLEWKRLALSSPSGVDNAYSKIAQQCLAVALNLHCIAWALGHQEEPDPQIADWAIGAAIYLCEYSLSQVLRRNSDSAIDLSPAQRKLIELSQSAEPIAEGWIKTKEICQKLRGDDGSKLDTNAARSLISTLIELGIGETREGGRGAIEWRFKTGTVPLEAKVDKKPLSTFVSTFVSTSTSEAQPGFEPQGRQSRQNSEVAKNSPENLDSQILSTCLPNSQNTDGLGITKVDNLVDRKVDKPKLSTFEEQPTVTVHPSRYGQVCRYCGPNPPNILGLDRMLISSIDLDRGTATVTASRWVVDKTFPLEDLEVIE